jgi:hypothetical protein
VSSISAPAPGSKTTQIAMYMENQGTLVANDVDWSRLKPLGINLQRCGITNTVSFLKANNKLKKESFDRVLVGRAMFRHWHNTPFAEDDAHVVARVDKENGARAAQTDSTGV